MDFVEIKVFTANSPPRTSLFFIRKTLKCVLSEGSHTVKNPGYRDFKSSYWKKILGYYRDFKSPTGRKSRVPGFQILVLEENSGHWDLKCRHWKKITSTRISNCDTAQKIPGLTGISNPSTGRKSQCPIVRTIRDPLNVTCTL